MVGALEEATAGGIPSGQVQELTVAGLVRMGKRPSFRIRQGDQQQFGNPNSSRLAR
jgi:hypothetical protein